MTRSDIPREESDRPQDPFRLWRKKLAEQERAREDLRQQMLDRLWRTLDDLHPLYGWDEAWAFGSITRPGAFTRRSDVDVAVAGLESKLLYQAIGEFSSRLGVDVDLVRLEECRFSAKIRAEGVPWKT